MMISWSLESAEEWLAGWSIDVVEVKTEERLGVSYESEGRNQKGRGTV
jgi:hypothetical protein